VLIAIPSKGRPTKVKSLKLLPDGVVFVPENEADAYRKAGVKNVVAVPQAVRGITKTRNWILEYAKDDPWVVFVDDDVKTAGWTELRDVDSRKRNIEPPVWTQEFVRFFELAEALGLRVWGVATDGATRAIYPYRPFIFHTYVTASCMGILNDGKTRFDESFPVKEDYELCLRCLREDGAILGVRYLYWVNDHWKTEGGCRDYRTQEMEREAIQRLIRRFPGMIRRVTRGGSTYSIELDF
jgi:hypothetical protein